MSSPSFRLGPDPNRTYLERWNEMHPDRYGRPDSYADSDHGWQPGRSEDDAASGNYAGGFLESLLSLAIIILAPVIGLIVTLLSYHWTRSDNLTPAWILGYVGVFLAATFTAAMLVYALRRVLLIFALAALASGVAYTIWHLWIA